MKKSSSRDETSFTSVAGPSYYNEYLQYGVSHCDDFFYIFKVTKFPIQPPICIKSIRSNWLPMLSSKQ